MKQLFDPVGIGGLKLKNRLFRSATQEGAADENGHVSPTLFGIYKNLAAGGVGTIITGMVGVDENSRIFPFMLKAYDDAFISGFRKITDEIHVYDARIVVQLSHCGVKASHTDRGNPPLGPSEITALPKKTAQSMTKDDIRNTVRSFASAASRCKEAGADGVQIHGAHGYLLSQFLSPFYNKRGDEYGGSAENRARIVLEVYDAIRAQVGNDYPIFIKINSEDKVEGGFTLDECVRTCLALDERGIDGIEVSGGIGVSKESSPAQQVRSVEAEGTFFANALVVANKVRAPVISVGGYRMPDIIEQCLNKGRVEAVSLCRPLICEPDLPDRWRRGDRGKARCISCSKCFNMKDGFGCKNFQGSAD
ncbi:MAG: NADH:flavin oxidoreductase [Synergistaceae bacterium]|jgi:2,4-dienoyl-CoA reductase-like NADH-dependent reductase (Old Yellow Enzyme family)|nr:NADH:flavin oxidoreductase [Synergistaceae bacterium]